MRNTLENNVFNYKKFLADGEFCRDILIYFQNHQEQINRRIERYLVKLCKFAGNLSYLIKREEDLYQ